MTPPRGVILREIAFYAMKRRIPPAHKTYNNKKNSGFTPEFFCVYVLQCFSV